MTEKQELELRFLLDLRKKQARRSGLAGREGKEGKKSSEEGLGPDLKRRKQSTGREVSQESDNVERLSRQNGNKGKITDFLITLQISTFIRT